MLFSSRCTESFIDVQSAFRTREALQRLDRQLVPQQGASAEKISLLHVKRRLLRCFRMPLGRLYGEVLGRSVAVEQLRLLLTCPS